MDVLAIIIVVIFIILIFYKVLLPKMGTMKQSNPQSSDDYFSNKNTSESLGSSDYTKSYDETLNQHLNAGQSHFSSHGSSNNSGVLHNHESNVHSNTAGASWDHSPAQDTTNIDSGASYSSSFDTSSDSD